ARINQLLASGKFKFYQELRLQVMGKLFRKQHTSAPQLSRSFPVLALQQLQQAGWRKASKWLISHAFSRTKWQHCQVL
ncbi:hypothetical protein, partial [Pseudomonas syringae]|uniref:hypothetical protein n=1 Tax=Pseudomonas syringae TaxID=317 RepID=UPI001F1D0B2C